MHDVIIDDTRTSMAASQERVYGKVKSTKPKKRRSFSVYLVDWIEKALIVGSLLAIDFLLFSGAGSYSIFAPVTFLTLEVWYMLAGIFVLSLVMMYIFSFSSFFQNILTSAIVSLFVVVMLNQFAAFDKSSMVSQLVATYINPDLGGMLSNVSHIIFACFLGFVFFLFLVCASKKLIAYFVMALLLIIGGIIGTNYRGKENNKFQVVKDDVIIQNPQPGKRFVFIGMPTAGSYNYLSEAAQNAVNPQEKEYLQKTRDLILGFYARNNFILHPYAYVEDLDPYANMAMSLNTNNNKPLAEYKLNNISVTKFWKFKNLAPKYMYLQENKLYDTFKRAKYGINAYQAGGIEMCYVNNELAVDRCIEKNYLPIDFDGMDISIDKKIEILAAQWIESMGLFNNFSYIYNLLRPFVNADKLPMVGVSYKNADVKNSLDVFDMLEKDLARDNGNKAYFVYLNTPNNMFIYDEFCRVKPIDSWQNKNDQVWAKKTNEQDKRQAYNEQLSCVFGRLEKFIETLGKIPSGNKTVLVLQGVSGINGMIPLKDNNFVTMLKNQKYVDMAIYDPMKKEFQVGERVCSAPAILKQYLYRKESCKELGEFNLHEDAIKEMRSSLMRHSVDKNTVAAAAGKFDAWYKEWQKAQPEQAFAAPQPEMTDVKVNLPGIIADDADADAEELPAGEAEAINDDDTAKVIEIVKTPEAAVVDGKEDKVESLVTTVEKLGGSEAFAKPTEKAKPEEIKAIVPAEDTVKIPLMK